MKPVWIIASLFLLVLAACSGGDQEVVANQIQANSVVVDHQGKVRVMGVTMYSAGVENPETGKMELTNGAPRQVGPGGPVTVYIFKIISPQGREVMKRERIKAEENTAYLVHHDARLGMDEFRKMKKIGRIDPSLSDAELAALFGVHVQVF